MADELSYPWFAVIRDQSLEQGDILQNFEIPDISQVFSQDSDDYDVVLQTIDVIVLTQSCDIEQNKARSLVLCPLSPLHTFISAAVDRGEEHWKSSKILESLRQGNIPGYHLISDFISEGLTFPISVVDFHEIYSAPTLQVTEFVSRHSPRLRLCPPYKEHLAQAFARFFMRVGLPVDIPREKLKVKL